MFKLLIATSCLLAVCNGFFMRPNPMRPNPMRINPIFNLGRGQTLNFTMFPTLEDICQQAVMKSGVTDGLSDVMRSAVDYFVASGQNLMTPKPGSANNAQWQCLLGVATKGGTTTTGANNKMGDYFDTVGEGMQALMPPGVFFNPCEMVFCGEQGITPITMVHEVLRKIRRGVPLGARLQRFAHLFRNIMPRGGPAGFARPSAANVLQSGSKAFGQPGPTIGAMGSNPFARFMQGGGMLGPLTSSRQQPSGNVWQQAARLMPGLPGSQRPQSTTSSPSTASGNGNPMMKQMMQMAERMAQQNPMMKAMMQQFGRGFGSPAPAPAAPAGGNPMMAMMEQFRQRMMASQQPPTTTAAPITTPAAAFVPAAAAATTAPTPASSGSNNTSANANTNTNNMMQQILSMQALMGQQPPNPNALQQMMQMMGGQAATTTPTPTTTTTTAAPVQPAVITNSAAASSSLPGFPFGPGFAQMPSLMGGNPASPFASLMNNPAFQARLQQLQQMLAGAGFRPPTTTTTANANANAPPNPFQSLPNGAASAGLGALGNIMGILGASRALQDGPDALQNAAGMLPGFGGAMGMPRGQSAGNPMMSLMPGLGQMFG